MRLINPILIKPSMVLSSNAPLSDYAAWSSTVTYGIGAQVTFDNNDYQSLINSNLNKQPNLNPTAWALLGAANRFKMFDRVISSSTKGPTGVALDVRIKPLNVITAISLFEVDADSVQIQVIDPEAGTVYDETVVLSNNVANWYGYFFAPIERTREITMIDLPVNSRELTLTELPSFLNADIRIIARAGSGVAKIGEVVVGQQRQLGLSLYGTSVSIQDFSRKERNEFGDTILVQRRFARTCDYDVVVDTAKVHQVQRALAEVRTTPTVFIGNPLQPETVIYGFFRSFSIVLSGPTVSDCTIEVESLV